MSVEELRDKSLEVLEESADVTFNLDKVNHLDARALQVLLALSLEQTERGRQLRMTNVSQDLRQWFELAGASDLLANTQRSDDE